VQALRSALKGFTDSLQSRLNLAQAEFKEASWQFADGFTVVDDVRSDENTVSESSWTCWSRTVRMGKASPSCSGSTWGLQVKPGCVFPEVGVRWAGTTPCLDDPYAGSTWLSMAGEKSNQIRDSLEHRACPFGDYLRLGLLLLVRWSGVKQKLNQSSFAKLPAEVAWGGRRSLRAFPWLGGVHGSPVRPDPANKRRRVHPFVLYPARERFNPTLRQSRQRRDLWTNQEPIDGPLDGTLDGNSRLGFDRGGPWPGADRGGQAGPVSRATLVVHRPIVELDWRFAFAHGCGGAVDGWLYLSIQPASRPPRCPPTPVRGTVSVVSGGRKIADRADRPP
jgi:hypothetical protein